MFNPQRRGSLWFLGTLLLAMALLLPACGGGGGGSAPPAPSLGVSTTPLTFTAPTEGGANPAAQTFVITNSGATGTTLDWSITDDAGWLTITPASGSLADGASTTISVSSNISGLLAGSQSATITIAATGLTAKTIATQLTIGQALTLNPGSLAVTVTAGSNPADQTLTLANASDLSVPWTAASDATWLSMSQTAGTLAANGQATLPAVQFTAQSLAAGTYTGNITITPTAAVTGVTIPVTLTVNAATSAAKNVFIGGTAGIGQLSSLVASASVGKAATTPTVLADANVTITTLKSDGTTTTTLAKTNVQGAYSAEVVAAAGDTITVMIEKDGFTSLNKTIQVGADTKNQYTVSGNVAETAVQVIKAADGVFKASGGTGPGFRFGLTRRASGALIPFAGSGEVRAAAAAGAVPELDISIPASWAPDATAVKTELAAFNPNVAAERQMFPGEFVGVGGGTAGAAKADATEYALESVSFFQAEVTPNSGQPLSPTVATGASKAAAEATVIYKYIPADGCTAVQKYADRDTDTTNGIQMPIYSYNGETGKWIYIGEGTLTTYDLASGTYSTVPYADVATATDLSNLACGTTDYYFEIIANEWYTWWNLDYPLLFAQPEITTISGTVVDQNGNPISGALVEADGYASGANTYTETYSATNGSFSMDLTLGDGSTAADYVFTAYDYSTWPPESSAFTSQLPTPIDPAGSNNVGNVVIASTLTCTVSGTILPASEWTWVALYTNDNAYYNWVYTDATGLFTAKVPCNKPINLETWQTSLALNVNGFIVSPEQSDDGTAIIIEDINLTNNAPDVSSWIAPNPVKAGQMVDLLASAWDYEGDYPLSYAWTVTDNAGTTVGSSSLDFFNWTPTTEGSYSVELNVSDSLNNTTTVNETLVVNPDVNDSPVIWWTSVEAPQTCGGQPSIFVEAYDPDGDNLTFSFSEGSPIYDPALGAWIPTTAPTGTTLTVTVTDDGTPSKSTSAIIDRPQASGLELYVAEAWPMVQTQFTQVDLFAYASDVGTSYTWTVTAPDSTLIPVDEYIVGDSSSAYFTPDQLGNYNITLDATGGPCGDTITRSITVSVVPLSVGVTWKYLQYRTYADSTRNAPRGWIQFTDNGALMNAGDFQGSSLYDPLGNWIADANDFHVDNYIWSVWDPTLSAFGSPIPSGDSGFWYNLAGLSPLPAGTYTYETQLAGGTIITTPVEFPGETALIPVSSTSMNYTWNADASLTLNWTAPTDVFDQYRIRFGDNAGDIFYGKVPQGTTTVTLSATMLQAIATNSGASALSSFDWSMQTRLYDANNTNYARSISGVVTITPPPGSVDVIIQ